MVRSLTDTGHHGQLMEKALDVTRMFKRTGNAGNLNERLIVKSFIKQKISTIS